MPTPTELHSQVVHVTVGVDTHADVHVAAALDQLGRLLGTHWPLSSNGAGSYGKASSFVDTAVGSLAT